jgi:hypothetical protein
VSDRQPRTGAGGEATGACSSTTSGHPTGSTGSDTPTGASPQPRRCVDGSPPATEPCWQCGVPRVRGDAYCEACGHAFSATVPQPAPGATVRPWAAIVAPDRAYFDRVAPGGMSFPSHAAPRKFVCDQPEIHIGRRSESRRPRAQIDLGEPPEDPAISHHHATLLRAPDGRYSIVDAGSTNGTTINDDPAPIPVGAPIPLADGDQIHLGVWTTITLTDGSASTDPHP